MSIPGSHPLLLALALPGGLIILVAAINLVIIRTNGSPVAAPQIPRTTETFGTGQPLRYVILGDSTTVSQGSDYNDGYVRASARYLAGKGFAVSLTNFGVSGARADDVASRQAAAAAKIKPDLVLIGVGANDVTHLTPIKTIKKELLSTITTLRAANPDTRIVITGSPQMGSVPRFPQPTKLLARLRTNQVNTMAVQLAADQKLTFAPIAAITGPVFDEHPEYFAADKFHPNKAGYAVWTPVVTKALSQAIKP